MLRFVLLENGLLQKLECNSHILTLNMLGKSELGVGGGQTNDGLKGSHCDGDCLLVLISHCGLLSKCSVNSCGDLASIVAEFGGLLRLDERDVLFEELSCHQF